MSFSPLWLFLILGIIIVIILIALNISPVTKRINSSVKVTTQQLPVLKPVPNPWSVSNTQGLPLDPVVQKCDKCKNDVCPNCQIYTFKNNVSQPVVPKIQNLPNCLNSGTCYQSDCNLNGVYPTCVWPDQTSVFYGSHVCKSEQGPFAGTGCASQNGTIVPLNTTETIYDTCGKLNYPVCGPITSGTLNLMILNWYPNGIEPLNVNAFDQFYCIQGPNSSSTKFTTSTCDISVFSQLWVIQRYSYDGVGLYQDSSGLFMSIMNRETGSYLIPQGFNPNVPGNWNPSEDFIGLTYYNYGINVPNNPGVFWMYYNLPIEFPKNPSGTEKGAPQFVFVPNYAFVPSTVFLSAFIDYIMNTNPYVYSITPQTIWYAYPENFVSTGENSFTYVRNTVGVPVNGTEIGLRKFTYNLNLTNPGLFYSLPLQFLSNLVEYTTYNDYVSQALALQNIS